MRDEECIEFLRWALPRLHLHWPGFRKVRRQVCRRVSKRIEELGFDGVSAYMDYLEETPEEWAQLDCACRVTISRFHRDRGVFEFLATTVLPDLARAADARSSRLEAWSAGCASGEEAYSLAIVWHLAVKPSFPGVDLRVVATDVDDAVLARARRACYPASSVRELPDAWRNEAFDRRDDLYCLGQSFRRLVTFEVHDLRNPPPGGPFDLVLCRNVAFTYFDQELQRDVVARLASALKPGGALVVGSHETLPDEPTALRLWQHGMPVYRRVPADAPVGSVC